MNQETKDYISTWKKRMSKIKGNDLDALFEKYTALFTLYNRLYNDSYKILRDEGKLNKPRHSDFEKATTIVIQFISSKDILSKLLANNNLEDLESIADLIKKGKFHINLADGVPQKEVDTQLMINLNSKDGDIKAQAVLSSIYNVRCNMLHGEKHFKEYQRLLLKPLIRILNTIVVLQMEKMK